MISRNEFSLIDNEVQDSILEVLEYIKSKCTEHDYVLFLADGEYYKPLKKSPLRLNPYTIDSRLDRYKDHSRQEFFLRFMRLFYSFPKRKTKTTDDEFRMTIELMIYTHIWESKPYLKHLFRLATLTNNGGYKWKIEVPENSKHDFIRTDIRDVLSKSKLKLADVISNGFHTSLRNAFAHSEYQFDDNSKEIKLDTYKGAKWDMPSITYNDWTRKFAYTTLTSYHFFNERAKKRQSLIEDFGKDTFSIIHPITESRARVKNILYEKKWDRFSFQDP